MDGAIRRKAKQQGLSLNQAALEAMAHGLGLAEEKPEYHDLDDLAGTWVEDPAFDEAIREMDTVPGSDLKIQNKDGGAVRLGLAREPYFVF
jgi:hypothetical protein